MSVHASSDLPRGRVSRGLIFAGLCGACLLLSLGYLLWAISRPVPGAQAPLSSLVTLAPAGAETGALFQGRPQLLFHNATPDAAQSKAGFAPLDAAGGPRMVTPLGCERVHYAAGQGLCLVAEPGFITRYWATLFGPDFQVQHRLELGGILSRARVSPDGRYGATTVFVSGHSYAEGGFSTQTSIIDLAAGTLVANLEEFQVERDGESFSSPDFNYWGVTFTQDSNRFYATLASRGYTYLVEGDVATRRVRALRENLECPSISPDNTRIAFKKRVGEAGGPVTWRLHVLDLATMAETPLAETRSVDDQVEWLDDGTILYGHEGAIWRVPADGGGSPAILAESALSPAVVR